MNLNLLQRISRDQIQFGQKIGGETVTGYVVDESSSISLCGRDYVLVKVYFKDAEEYFALLTSEPLSWRFVLDCKSHEYGHISKMIHVAMLAHYNYFVWNDRVYELDGDCAVDTGWIHTDLR